MKKIVVFFIGIISLLKLEAQCADIFDNDTVFWVDIIYFSGERKVEPKMYTIVLSVEDEYYIDLSDHATMIKSLKEGVYLTNVIFPSHKMIEETFPDSSSDFKGKAYENNFGMWYNTYSKIPYDVFQTGMIDCFDISVTKIVGITRRNVGGFHIAVGWVKDIVPMFIDDACIKGDGMVLSKKYFYEK